MVRIVAIQAFPVTNADTGDTKGYMTLIQGQISRFSLAHYLLKPIHLYRFQTIYQE